MAAISPTAVNHLQLLLHNELAATEAYDQAVALANSDPGSVELQVIHADHREAAEALSRYVEFLGGVPEKEAAVWHHFAVRIAEGAKLAGNREALATLRDAEVQGNRLYEEALLDDTLPEECLPLITGTLLPQGRGHVVTLERVLQEL